MASPVRKPIFPLDQSALDRFHQWHVVGNSDECWPWEGGLFSNGYGRFCIGARHIGAHRIAWCLANQRDVPSGLVIRHKCDNPICCNPSHLESGTKAQNTQDMVIRGRVSCAARKLTDAEITAVRALIARDHSNQLIGALMGISATEVVSIKTGHRWGRHERGLE